MAVNLGATRELSPETAQAGKVRLVEPEVAALAVDVISSERRIPSRASMMLAVKHEIATLTAA